MNIHVISTTLGSGLVAVQCRARIGSGVEEGMIQIEDETEFPVFAKSARCIVGECCGVGFGDSDCDSSRYG